MVKPFNGIGVFYGRFVKDFSTHMSLEDDVVNMGIKLHCSHNCGLVFILLEQLCKAYFDKNLMMRTMTLHKLHMHDVVLIIHVEHKDLWLHCAYDFDHFLKLLKQVSEIHCDELCLLNDNPSCKLDVCCDEPTLCVEYEFVNLWSSSYLSKDDVSMVPYGLLLLNLENMNLVNRPYSVTLNIHTMRTLSCICLVLLRMPNLL